MAGPNRASRRTGPWDAGTVNNIKTFIHSILEGKPVNNTAAGAVSTLTAVLGREAARAERVITWDEILKSEKRLQANLKLRY
jgi:hypothetical protein